MNQELLNSEPNMIIFRKKNTMQSKHLVIKMSRQCYVNMCVFQITGKISMHDS